MITGTLALIALFGLLTIAFFKIENLAHKGENRTILRSSLEFSLSAFLLLFLLFGVYVNTAAANDNAIFNADVLESSQYLRLGSYLFLGVLALFLLEVIIHFGMVGTRKRMEPSKQ